MRIVCVGGGPGNLLFASLMRQVDDRHDITVLERNPAGITQGWGVVFWDDLLESLGQADPDTAREISAAAYQWHGVEVDLAGRTSTTPEATGYSIARTKLISILTARARTRGVRVEFDRELNPGELTADADLVVAGDGNRSSIRSANAARLGTDLVPSGNRFVWLGSTKVFDSFTFAFVDSPAGWLWCHAYGYDQDRSTFIVECSPATWRGLRLDQLDLDDSLALLEQLFSAQLDGHRLLAQPGTEAQRMAWRTFTTVRNRRWHLDNVALLGDAAHTTHFSIGSGTKLAMEDAIALAAGLSRHRNVEVALSEYETRRRHILRRAQRDSRYSARWFENVERYTGLEADQFSDLMDRRRSRALAHVPPAVYLGLRGLAAGSAAGRQQSRGQQLSSQGPSHR